MSAPLRVGIDLGTTFSCVSAVDARGHPVVVRNGLGLPTTPSVVWFDGHEAVVGECAYAAEAERPGHLVQLVKREMGHPVKAEPGGPPPAPYLRGGHAWGVVGIQALLLRQFRLDAVAHFRGSGQLAPETPDDEALIEAVVTVPAYFKNPEREQVRQAARLAGLHLIGLINEPTAAALAYRLVSHGEKVVFVFDLGGGTFDVTVLRLAADGRAEVLATAGNPKLGGTDWDDLILRHLIQEQRRLTGSTPDAAAAIPLRRRAAEAKIALSTHATADVSLPLPDGQSLDLRLHRTPPVTTGIVDLDDPTFYLEEASRSLLTQLRSLCQSAIEAADLTHGGGLEPWKHIHEVVMVGGSCRMPMIPQLLEDMGGGQHRVQRHPKGFDFDTAVAIGAAHYAMHPSDVRDVTPGAYGARMVRALDRREVIVNLVPANAPLPYHRREAFEAEGDACLDIYLGESRETAECRFIGDLPLDNVAGGVEVEVHVDTNGTLRLDCRTPTGERRQATITLEHDDEHEAETLRRMEQVQMIPCLADEAASGGAPARPATREGDLREESTPGAGDTAERRAKRSLLGRLGWPRETQSRTSEPAGAE